MENKATLRDIGNLIAKYRKSKGLTQSDLASYLKTSQSAIARMEKGEQNLTAQMISKISKILGKNLLTLSEPSLNLKILGGYTLKGEVSVRSSRMSSLFLLYASLLNKNGTVQLKDLPKMPEVERSLDLFEILGVKYTLKDFNNLNLQIPSIKSSLTIKKSTLSLDSLPISAVLLFGALSGVTKTITLPLFKRPFALNPRFYVHKNALEQLGVVFKIKEDSITADFKKIHSGEVFLSEFSNTATVNTLLIASQLKGTTVIKKASMDYSVVDVCLFLKKLGVNIKGIGTPTLIVEGSNNISPKNIKYSPIPDPLEALFYISASLITKSTLKICNVPLSFLEPEISLLKEMGANLKTKPISDKDYYKQGCIVVSPSTLKNVSYTLYPQVYPGIRYDSWPYLVSLFSVAEGPVLVNDWMSTERSYGFSELKKLGVDIFVADLHRFLIKGASFLRPAYIHCPLSLHPGDVFLLLMLGAKGESHLLGSFSVSRWSYELISKLNALGAKITFVYDV